MSTVVLSDSILINRLFDLGLGNGVTITQVNNNYTTLDTDQYIEVETPNITITLHTPSQTKLIHIDNKSNGNISVNNVQDHTLILNIGEGTYLLYNGTEWRVK